MIWDEATEKIRTNDSVTITKQDQTIKGVGLESDQNFINYEIKHVSGILNVEKNKTND